MKKRLRELDLLRGFVTLSVIAIHISGAYVYSSNTVYVWNQLMRYAVPIFILLSGLVLFYSDNSAKKEPAAINFYNKRLKKIIIPYLIWSIIYILYDQRHSLTVYFSNTSILAKTVSKQLLLGTASYHLYFILIILQLYLLYPLLKSAFRAYPKTTLAVSFLITLFFQMVVYLRAFSITILPEFFLPYYIAFPTWIFFFVFGMYVSKNLDAYKQKLSEKKVISIIVWVISFALLLIDSKTTKSNELSIKPSVMLYCLTSFNLFYLISLKFSENKSPVIKLLDWISSQSFLIYFSHILVLNLVKSNSYRFGIGEFWESARSSFLLFIIVSVFTIMLSYALSFIPFVSIFGGVPRRKPPGRK